MLRLYCRAHHTPSRTGSPLCAECQSLQDYAAARLERCVFRAEKPTCANCPVHCYAAAYRERVKVVMRYAGPRMLWRHPVLAIGHLLDGRRPVPPLRPPGPLKKERESAADVTANV